MNNKSKRVLKFSGYMFTIVAAILFYNHLFVAATNPGFFVVVYFDFFGEGLLELILFSCFIPFIIYAFALEVIEIRKLKRGRNYEKRSRPLDRK